MRKWILVTASVLALGIGGVAVDHAANAGNSVPNAGWNMPPAPGTSQHLQTAANLSKDDFRQAQLELRNMGLYNGSLDGVVGPETKRATPWPAPASSCRHPFLCGGGAEDHLFAAGIQVVFVLS